MADAALAEAANVFAPNDQESPGYANKSAVQKYL
jgi:hypothetical protein